MRPASIRFQILLLAAALIACALYLPYKIHHSSQDVTILAKEYLGAPYRYGGASPDGFDCSGFIMYLFHKCGKDLPRTADKQAAVGSAVSIPGLQPGDVLFFATEDKSDITHTGLYIGSRKFIHASSTAQKVIISSLDEPYWQNALRAARHIRP